MFANRFTAFLDACVLAPAGNRDLILCLAEDKFFRPRWSRKVLQETEVTVEKLILRRHPEHAGAKEKARQVIGKIGEAFPEACVSDDYKALENAFELPDSNDKHVLAGAIHCRASTLVTDNQKDFPRDVTEKFNIEVRTADQFIADEIDLDVIKAVQTVRRMRSLLSRPTLDASEFLLTLEARGLSETTRLLRPYENLI